MNIDKVNKIKEIVRRYKSVAGTNDIREVIDICNIKIQEVYNLEEMNYFKGMYYKSKSKQTIVLNKALPEKEQEIVLAHEFAHSKLHRNIDISYLLNDTFFICDPFELEANTLAAEFLIEDDTIINLLIEDPTSTYKSMSQTLGLPEELIELKYEYLDKDKLKNIHDF